PRYQPSDFPKVDRTLKGDRLIIAPPQPAAPASAVPAIEDPATSNSSVMGAKTADISAERAPLDPELAEALNAPPLPQYEPLQPQPGGPEAAADSASIPVETTRPHDPFSVKTASLFFGSNSLGAPLETIERWQPGEEPVVVLPGGADDPDMKPIA